MAFNNKLIIYYKPADGVYEFSKSFTLSFSSCFNLSLLTSVLGKLIAIVCSIIVFKLLNFFDKSHNF